MKYSKQGYAARDENGRLNFFFGEPRRFSNHGDGEDYWIGHARMKLPNEFLPELSWEDEPIEVTVELTTKKD